MDCTPRYHLSKQKSHVCKKICFGAKRAIWETLREDLCVSRHCDEVKQSSKILDRHAALRLAMTTTWGSVCHATVIFHLILMPRGVRAFQPSEGGGLIFELTDQIFQVTGHGE